MHLIRCVCCATSKLKTRYRNCIRLSQKDTTPRTKLIYQMKVIRFIPRTIVEFNYWQLPESKLSELNSTIVRRINRALVKYFLTSKLNFVIPSSHAYCLSSLQWKKLLFDTGSLRQYQVSSMVLRFCIKRKVSLNFSKKQHVFLSFIMARPFSIQAKRLTAVHQFKITIDLFYPVIGFHCLRCHGHTCGTLNKHWSLIGSAISYHQGKN